MIDRQGSAVIITSKRFSIFAFGSLHHRMALLHAASAQVKSLRHADANNMTDSLNLVLPASRRLGGRLLPKAADGKVEQIDFVSSGGIGCALSGVGATFDATQQHATRDWLGIRTILVAFSCRDVENLAEDDLAKLKDLKVRDQGSTRSGPRA